MADILNRIEYDIFGSDGKFSLNVQVLDTGGKGQKCQIKVLQGATKSEIMETNDVGFIDDYPLEIITEGDVRTISLRVIGTDLNTSFTIKGPRRIQRKRGIKTIAIEKKVMSFFVILFLVIMIIFLLPPYYSLWWKYWMIMGGGAGLTVLYLIYNNPATNYASIILSQLLSNNNWRAILFFIIGIILAISAILAGFGEPILNTTMTEVAQTTKQWCGIILYGYGEDEKPAPPAEKDEIIQYASWINWIIAIVWWVLAILYGIFATREEVADAWSAAIKAFRAQTKITSGATGRAITSPTKEFMREFNIEVLIEFCKFYITKLAKISKKN